MKSVLIAALCLVAPVSAFVPASVQAVRATPKGAASVTGDGSSPVNGWAPDASKFCYGLPGTLAPWGDFDPWDFSAGKTLEEVKMYRESEVTHGRVSMLAVLGFLVQEKAHFLFVEPEKDIGPAIRHLDEVRAVSPAFFEGLALFIGAAELIRSQRGWKNPSTSGLGSWPGLLEDNYYPGDIGFDPLGLKPKGAEEFAEMQTKELQNGRLAMLAIAGFVAQELVDGSPILETQAWSKIF